jgi:hypothetical protein
MHAMGNGWLGDCFWWRVERQEQSTTVRLFGGWPSWVGAGVCWLVVDDLHDTFRDTLRLSRASHLAKFDSTSLPILETTVNSQAFLD